MSALSARVMVKPDGLARTLSSQEASDIAATWNDLLSALAGRANQGTPKARLVGELPTIIAGRKSYRRGYDLETWRAQARTCPQLATDQLGPISVRDQHAAILSSLGLTCYEHVRGTLTTEEVDSIYRPSQWYAEDPAALTAYMQSGPVVREKWRGTNIELSLLAKFAIRSALGVEGRLNLVHCDLVAMCENSTQW